MLSLFWISATFKVGALYVYYSGKLSALKVFSNIKNVAFVQLEII